MKNTYTILVANVDDGFTEMVHIKATEKQKNDIEKVLEAVSLCTAGYEIWIAEPEEIIELKEEE